jgi:hypothetical protein
MAYIFTPARFAANIISAVGVCASPELWEWECKSIMKKSFPKQKPEARRQNPEYVAEHTRLIQVIYGRSDLRTAHPSYKIK